MLPELKFAYEIARWAHEEIYKQLQVARTTAPVEDLPEMVDIVYACREIGKFVDDLQKESRGLDKFVSRLACLKWLKMVDSPHNIKTEYATATPDMRICAGIPDFRHTPDAYNKLMDYLGIDPVLRDSGDIDSPHGTESTEVVRIHWPGFQSLVNRLTTEGYSLPDGIDPSKNYTDYKLGMRGRKKISDPPTAEELRKEGSEENPF